MTKRWGTMVAVAAVSFVSGGLLLKGAAARGIPAGPAIFTDVFELVRQNYVDTLAADSLYRKAAAGMVAELHDPYSEVMERDDYRQITEQTSGNYGGLGMQIDVRGGWITVVAPLPGTPAERAGIESGDQVVDVDGKSTQGLTSDEALKVLRGQPGTKVEIKVRRPGIPALMPFALTRETIHNRSVQPGILFPGDIGYVALTPVSETSAQELRDEIVALRRRGMKGLVFDLRGNPGGLLTQGIAVSDLFLDPGQTIVSTKGRMANMNQSFADEAKQEWPELPVVVLVNEWSASAAEIIAGALQDNDRAVVIGTTTFGKGLVQTLFPLGRDRALKLTTARWYTPSGRTIQRSAKDETEQVQQATDEAAGRDSARRELPTFRTAGGRTVRGGGGIVPDRVVRADSVTDVEKTFVKALGGNVAIYRDALVATALELKEKRSVTTEAFEVTEAMRALVLARLKAKGVELTPAEIAAGTQLLTEQIGYETARYVFGRQAETRRRAQFDPQMRAALDLLQGAPTPKQLFTRVGGG